MLLRNLVFQEHWQHTCACAQHQHFQLLLSEVCQTERCEQSLVNFESQSASVEDDSLLLLWGAQLGLSLHRVSDHSFRRFCVPVDNWDFGLANGLMPVES